MSLDAATLAALEWARDLLTAESWPAWVEIAHDPPAGESRDAASLLVSDPTHGVRRLLSGDDTTGSAGSPAFVDGLASRAPELEAMQHAWSGAYRAADHGLLFAPTTGVTHVLILPLRRNGRLVGAYSVAGHGGPPRLAALDPSVLAHLGAVIASSAERLVDRARLLQAGQTDTLTGWSPARYLQARLAEEIARCQRHGGSVACVVVDVDGLQAVNERHGQSAGDRALVELASRIEAQVRTSDAAARMSSDEFAVVLPQTDSAGALPLARRMLDAVSRTPVDLGDGLLLPFTVSVGIAAIAPARGVERTLLAEQLLAEAGAALARAKQRGGSVEIAG